LSQNNIPEYVVIGHITKDNTPTGPILGGTPSYAGLTAHQLGRRTAIVTSYGPDAPSLTALNGIEMKVASAEQSTTFENIYVEGVRFQKWHASATPLALEHVPPAWHNAPIIHLSPMGQELSPGMCSHFPNSLVCVTIQGWLRGQDDDDNVIYQPHPDLDASLGCIDILVMSLADVKGDRAAADYLLTSVKIGVETLGPQGCRVYHNGEVVHVPVQSEREVDPTGAGDIFAAAFFIHYRDTGDVIQAARFANTCGALSVRQVGIAGVPRLAEVETHLANIYASHRGQRDRYPKQKLDGNTYRSAPYPVPGECS